MAVFDFASTSTTGFGTGSVQQMVSGVVVTVTADTIFSSYMDAVVTTAPMAAVTTVTVTFSSAVDLTSFGFGSNSGTVTGTATPIGGSNSAASLASISGVNNPTIHTVNWTGVTGFTVTSSTAFKPCFDSFTFSVDTTAPGAPSAPDLIAADDTGQYDTDDWTRKAAGTYTGTAEANSRVILYDGGSTAVGTATASSGGNWTITSSSLSNGQHSLTAKAIDASGNTSTASSALTVTIDATPPSVTGVTLSQTEAMKIGEVVTATIGVTSDSDTYTLGTSTVDGFALGDLSRVDNSTYTGVFTVTSGGTDVAGSADIPVSIVLTDSVGNANTVYTTGVSGEAGDAIDANAPAVTSVSISNSAAKAGDIVTATIGVTSDSDTLILDTGSIAGYQLAAGSRLNSSTYTATFTLTSGGTDYLASADLPVSIVYRDSAGNVSTAYTTSISQSGDAIDANRPVVSSVSIANATMKVGDVVTATIGVTSDADTYTLGSSTIGGFALGNLNRSNSSTYTATFTVTEGGTDVAAGSTVPVSVVLSDTAGNSSTTYSTAISQGSDAIDAHAPTVTGVTLSQTSAMKVGDIVTATIGVGSHTDTFTLGSSSIDGFALGNLVRVDNSTYRATFTVTNGGTDVAGASDIPVSIVLTDAAGNSSGSYTTGVSGQAGDSIDANRPVVSSVSVANTTMKVGDVVTATIGVTSDADTYTLGSSSIGGFALGNLNRTNGSTYTATFTVTEGGTDVAAASNVPVSVVLTDTAGNTGAAYTTAIVQGSDAIDANRPSITGVSIPNATMKVGDVVTATISVGSHLDTYTLGSSTIGGFALGNLTRYDNSTYRATFTVTSGGTDVAAASSIPVSVVLTDAAGNASATHTTAIAQGSDAIDANAPTLASSSPVDNATGVGVTQNLVLTFAEAVQAGTGAVTLYKTGVGTPVETFAVTDARVTIVGTQVTINPNATLDNAASYYVEIAAGALTDAAGNAYAGLSGATAYNFTTVASAPPPPQDDTPSTPTPPTTPGVVQTTTTQTVDGVQVQQTTQTRSDGTVTQTLSVPVVTTTRSEQDATTSNADIPLARDTVGQTVLEAHLPVGVGLQVETTTTTSQTGAGQGIQGLIQAIESRTQDKPEDKGKMTSVGQAFLGELPANAELTVRTIVPVVADPTTPPAAPIIITGTPTVPATGGGASPSTQQQALVIDVRNLPKGTVIQLQNVEFAAIVGDVQVTGGAGSQMVVGDSGNQIIVLGADDDTLRGGGGNDFVGSEGGDDQLWGDEGHDTVTGGIGNDVLYGNQQDDLLYGNQGADTLFGGQDADTAFGGQDGDVLYGNLGGDALYGNLGADTVFGGQGNDALFGGQGDDALHGNLGDDTLDGGAGTDTLGGGEGADVFRVNAPAGGGDVITDFQAGVDRIAVLSPNFGNLAAGTLSARNFALDVAADGDDLFVFNTRTGALSFDADGSGAAAAVTIAVLNVRTLSASDILILPSGS
ncbi:beta strand repeat-containing protein [Azospirillum sp.]|uniref:beta strand repeat-containing protein n=1 Tax=Azospirillum sp. TaxID=34012 RepID=UPI002D355631|nr:Ig-like domain-containing protein [Azospirillum sp.]HYD71486.1 Ig-like domain-containing protein [Azospirillum sp.]